jgi:hypothetical protein
VVEGLDSLIDALAPMLPRLVEPLPIQLARVDVQHLAAEPLDGLDLDSSRAPQPAGRLDRAHVPLERLGPGQLRQVRNTLLVGAGFQGLQQRPSGQLGARVGPQKRRTPLLAGGRVQALEYRPHLLGAGGSLEAGGGGGAAREPAW